MIRASSAVAAGTPPLTPAEEQLTDAQSVSVCYAILFLGLSNACHARGLFEAGDYAHAPLHAGQPVQRRLIETDRTRELVRGMLEGVLPALQAGFLSGIVFTIADAAADAASPRVREALWFQFTDSAADRGRATSAMGVTRQAAETLAYMSACLHSAEALGSDPIVLSLELVYNARAPRGYTPCPRFDRARDVAGRTVAFARETAVLGVAAVETGTHAVVAWILTPNTGATWRHEQPLPNDELSLVARSLRAAAPGWRGAARLDGGAGADGADAGRAQRHALFVNARRACERLAVGTRVTADTLQRLVPLLERETDACGLLAHLVWTGVLGEADRAAGGHPVLAPPALDPRRPRASTGAGANPTRPPRPCDVTRLSKPARKKPPTLAAAKAAGASKAANASDPGARAAMRAQLAGQLGGAV